MGARRRMLARGWTYTIVATLGIATWLGFAGMKPKPPPGDALTPEETKRVYAALLARVKVGGLLAPAPPSHFAQGNGKFSKELPVACRRRRS